VNGSSITVKTVLFWFFIIMLGLVLYRMFPSGDSRRAQSMNYSEFMNQVEKANIRDLILYPHQNTADAEGHLRDPGEAFSTTIPKEEMSELIRMLRQRGVPIEVKERAQGDWTTFLVNAAPLILLVGFWVFMMRQMRMKNQGGPGT
jgi:cell division protease FtsH